MQIVRCHQHFIKSISDSVIIEHLPPASFDSMMDQPISFIGEQFPYLTDQDVQELVSLGTLKKLEAGQLFIRAGETTFSTAVVISGMLRNFHITDEGDDKTVLFTIEGQSALSYATVFTNQPSADNIEALEPTLLLVSDFRDIKKLSHGNTRIAQMINEKLEKRLVETISRIDDFTLRNPEQRYIRFAQGNPALLERVQQKHLASFLGITPISLSRIKTRLRKRNIL